MTTQYAIPYNWLLLKFKYKFTISIIFQYFDMCRFLFYKEQIVVFYYHEPYPSINALVWVPSKYQKIVLLRDLTQSVYLFIFSHWAIAPWLGIKVPSIFHLFAIFLPKQECMQFMKNIKEYQNQFMKLSIDLWPLNNTIFTVLIKQ